MKPLITIIGILFLWSCQSGNEAKEAQSEEEKIVPVNVVQSEEKKYTPQMELAGTIKPWREANLGAALPGRVEEIVYKEGSYVEKGSLLVKLSGEKLAQAKAEFNALKKDMDRLKRLKKEGSVSEQDFDHLKSKYEAAKARVDMMQKNTTIHAPFSGVITSYQVQEGENFVFSPKLKPGYSHTSGIVSLMQLNRLKVAVEINEKELRRVSKGDSARITADAYPEDTLKGQVHWIAPTLSAEARTAKTEIAIPNPGRKYKPGMYATVNIRLPETRGIFVPLNAIFRLPGTGEDFVFAVQEDNSVERKKIIRISTRGKLVLVEGIKAGQTLVTDGKSKLSTGQKVRIAND